MIKIINIEKKYILNEILTNYNFGEFFTLVYNSDWASFNNIEFIATISLQNNLNKEDNSGTFVIRYNELTKQYSTELYMHEDK